MSESTANDTFNYWFPLLQELLPSSLLEQVKKNVSDYEIVQDILTDYELIVDSTEQPRERPGEYKEQKKYYSGKKKNHTFKNQITVLPDRKDIVDVVAGQPGPKSDINLFREGRQGFNPNQKFKGVLVMKESNQLIRTQKTAKLSGQKLLSGRLREKRRINPVTNREK